MQALWAEISQTLSSHLNAAHQINRVIPVSGGSIHSAYKACSGQACFFIKLNHPHCLDMFQTEAAALDELYTASDLRIPRPICTGQAQQRAFIAMEFIHMPAGNPAMPLLGERLARMHLEKQSCYGWQRNNHIGLTPQINTCEHDWQPFWQIHRLGFQLKLAETNAIPASLLDKALRIQDNLGVFFHGYTPFPSRLHGDLWSGNIGTDKKGQPVTFDPALYYGDRETDLAMTELFGGFDRSFYLSYQAVLPVDPGYAVRKDLYNLYHLLNHFNLFGGGYLSQIETKLDRLNAEL